MKLKQQHHRYQTARQLTGCRQHCVDSSGDPSRLKRDELQASQRLAEAGDCRAVIHNEVVL